MDFLLTLTRKNSQISSTKLFSAKIFWNLLIAWKWLFVTRILLWIHIYRFEVYLQSNHLHSVQKWGLKFQNSQTAFIAKFDYFAKFKKSHFPKFLSNFQTFDVQKHLQTICNNFYFIQNSIQTTFWLPFRHLKSAIFTTFMSWPKTKRLWGGKYKNLKPLC